MAAALVVALAGCRAPGPLVPTRVAPAMRVVLHTTLATDVNDPEWEQKLDGLTRYGNVRGYSTVMQVVRPRFGVVTPYLRVGDKYDLSKWSPEFFAHLERVLSWAERQNPRVLIQFDMFNEPTARNDRMLPAYDGDNIQGFKGDFPSFVRNRPTGAWEVICRALIQRMVPYVNRGGAVLFVLEGTGSEPFERWCLDAARSYGLSPSVYVVTNDGLAGAIKSPHCKSVACVRGNTRPGSYVSDDGWTDAGPGDVGACAKASDARGGAAFETFFAGILSGYKALDANGNVTDSGVPKERRERPTMSQLTRGAFPRYVMALN
jgi:hypothetical protein